MFLIIFRPESIDQHLNAAAGQNLYDSPHNLSSASGLPDVDDVDDLPPPPPEMIYLPPSSLKKPAPPTPVRKPTNTKRISFDDDVQVIGAGGVSENVNKQLTSGPECGNVNKQLPYGSEASSHHVFPENHQDRKIYSFIARQPYNASPKKLFTEESNCQAAPPKAFLQDLQRVMTKKWQVAEKCRSDGASVHHVYGFR